jgi:hypothetical protein
MMQPAESFTRKDATASHGTNSSARRSLPQSEMRAVLVVVTHVFREQPLQMAFIHGNHVIQQVPAAALDPTLRDAILPRTLKRSPDWPDLQRSNRRGNFDSILPVPVEDQKPGAESNGNASRSY